MNSDQSAPDPPEADAFNAFESAGWQHQAPTYDDFIGRVTSRLVDPLLDAANVRSGSRLLDVATGPGYAAANAARRGARVTGVDIAPAMIALASSRYPDIEFVRADAESLPFDAGAFDAVVANFLVPHLGRPRRVMAELVRVLADGGRLSLTTWDTADHMRVLGIFLEAFAQAGAAPPPDIPVGPPFFRYADDGTFAALLTDHGLVDARIHTIAFTHRVSSSDEYWDGMLGGTVRTSALVAGQDDETRQRVRRCVDQLLLGLRSGDDFELPISVKLASGRKKT